MSEAAQQAAQEVQNTEPQLGTAEYDAAMAAKGGSVDLRLVSDDGRQVTQLKSEETNTEEETSNTDRPAWLPEKFKTPEEMVASYSELEKKLNPPKEQAPADQQQQQQQQAPANIDISKYETEFESNGSLSEASYNELLARGIDKTLVDNYIAGRMASANEFINAGYEAAGGKEQFGQMSEWAKANLKPAEIAAFNAQVSSGNVEQMRLAVTGLNAKFLAANGSAPRGLLSGSSKPATGSSAFQSRAEVTAAMSDPRYANDPAYRQNVMNKLANSNVF